MDALIFTVVALLFLAIYFLPTFVAVARKKVNEGAIFVLNLFLGWSLIGWVVALLWALSSPETSEAQVVGAGYSINDDAGILAIFFKMVRVLALPVVILAVSYWYNSRDRSVLNFPIFILGFLVTAFLANSVEFPDVIINIFVTISSWLLVCAIAAIGMKTQFSDMKKVELSLFLFVTMESIFILLLSLGFLNFVLK